jgi:two-component system, OmpR family, KDP operon response regulator KdpE
MTETGSHILVVDDERAIRRFLKTALTAQGYQVTEVYSGEEALNAVVQSTPDVIILDLGLPGMDGIEVTQRLREWTHTPIIILSVQDREDDKIRALDAGADDYLTKPFSVNELMARIRVAMRHTLSKEADAIFYKGNLEVDLTKRIVKVEGSEVSLTPTEYDLLRALVHHAGKVITHSQLLREVRGSSYADETHLLRVHMSNLRKKIEPDLNHPEYIVTEPGVGYRLLTE